MKSCLVILPSPSHSAPANIRCSPLPAHRFLPQTSGHNLKSYSPRTAMETIFFRSYGAY